VPERLLGNKSVGVDGTRSANCIEGVVFGELRFVHGTGLGINGH
jgi:hypothetical protein